MDGESDEVKIYFPNHDGESSESMWAEPVGEGTYRLLNSPFRLYNISYKDVVRASDVDGRLHFIDVVQRSGHSTYRIAVMEQERRKKFPDSWTRLSVFCCTYESDVRENMDIYSVDVPNSADIHAVFRVLEQEEMNGNWEFEEAHVGHEL